MAERPVHIGIDGRELLGRPTGVGRYLRQVLGVWTADPAWPHRLTIVVPAAPPPETTAELGPRVTWRVEAAPRTGTWWEQRHLPRGLARAGADVLFAPAYTAPRLLPCPFVVLIHDVSFAAHPEWFTWRDGLRRRWLTRSAARRAARILTVSEFSADEIVRWLGVPRDRLALAPPGGPDVIAAPAGPRPPLVLYVGSLFNRRQIPLLLEGIARARTTCPDIRAVLVGDNRTSPRIDPRDVAATLGLGDRVEWREYVSDAELEALYETARVFAFLSTYEGFAMTPLEALAHGVPPVLLDTPVAREIYGGAARLVSSPESLGTALADLLQHEDARADLVEAGRSVRARFTWTRTAGAVRAALERAAETR